MNQPSFDLEFDDDGALDDAGLPTFSVSELGDAINGALKRSFSDGVWVRGEIQGWSVRGAHAYFNLAEETESGKATLNVQFFAPAQQKLRPMLAKHRLRLADGMKVRIFGYLDFFAPTGRLGLKMTSIDPRFTLGELALHRDEVVRRLVANGQYDLNRRRPLGPAPLRVGVVASSASAAWGDFRHELERSGFGFQVRLAEVRVQGEQAVHEITGAIRTLARQGDLDALVLIRGGGSRTELATFDHEAIAIAIAECPLPVFTGIGHEVDRSVADEVAHTALKTPTACAAALVERVQLFGERAEKAWERIEQSAKAALAAADGSISEVVAAIGHRVVASVDRANDRLGQRAHRVHLGAERAIERADARVSNAVAYVGRSQLRLEPEARHLSAVAERLRLLDPVNTMARGWSVARTADGRAVVDAATLNVGDVIVTTFANGAARSRVEETQQ